FTSLTGIRLSLMNSTMMIRSISKIRTTRAAEIPAICPLPSVDIPAREISLNASGSVFRDTIKVTGVCLLGVGQNQSAALAVLALLVNINLLVAAERAVVTQKLSAPVPLYFSRRNRGYAADNARVLPNCGLGVPRGEHHHRAAGKVVEGQLDKGPVHKLLRAVADRRDQSRKIVLDQPLLHFSEVAIADPGVVVELDARELVQGVEGPRVEGGQPVPVELQRLQGLEAPQPVRLDLGDLSVREVEFYQAGGRPEHVRLDPDQGVPCQGQVSEEGRLGQALAGDRGQSVVAQVELYQIRQSVQRLLVYPLHSAISKVNPLQVGQLDPDEDVAGQQPYVVVARVQHLGLRVYLLRDARKHPLHTLDGPFATLPLARTLVRTLVTD
ncbi:GSCOCG00003860001-RA-CDS, partial [Cotesia congregata]